MSTIQTQINLVHLEAGLAVPSVLQRTTYSSQFSSNAIEVTTADETIPLGDIITPKQVMVKLISGDPVRIGLDGSTYPFRLDWVDEGCILPIDASGRVEVSTATVVPDSSGSLDNKFFTLSDRHGEVKVVITNDGVTGLTSSGRLVIVDINNSDTAIAVATAIVTAFIGDPEIVASNQSDTIVKFSDKHTGTRTNINPEDSTFSVATTQEGSASPVIHLKSVGVSQVLVAVAPY